MKKIKFYYAEKTHETWAKLFVLTDDGILYCEYLDHLKPATFSEKVDFSTFDASKFKWSNYQSIVEIDQDLAVKTALTRQKNWVLNYINTI